jgi:hypothetical protein
MYLFTGATMWDEEEDEEEEFRIVDRTNWNAPFGLVNRLAYAVEEYYREAINTMHSIHNNLALKICYQASLKHKSAWLVLRFDVLDANLKLIDPRAHASYQNMPMDLSAAQRKVVQDFVASKTKKTDGILWNNRFGGSEALSHMNLTPQDRKYYRPHQPYKYMVPAGCEEHPPGFPAVVMPSPTTPVTFPILFLFTCWPLF